MKFISPLKYVIVIIAIIFLFSNWKIAVLLFLVSSLLHVFPAGPNALLSTITGYLAIGGFIYLFVDLKIGIILIVLAFLVAKFRIWANKENYKYYNKK